MMLNARRLIALLVTGVAVIALALWASSRNPAEGPTQAGEPILPGLEHSLNTITEVRLVKGDGTRTTLKKSATDWIIGERGFPADSSRVRKLLLDLAQLKVVEDKTTDPASYAEIGVEDVNSPKAGGTRIELIEPDKTLSLIVGNTSGSSSSYVRVASAKRSFLASPQVVPEADPRRWLDENVIDLSESRVANVVEHPASGPAYTVTRPTVQQAVFNIPSLPKGRELASVSAANPVASALSGLTLDDIRKAGNGATYSDHATFRTFDGLTVDVSGRKEGDHRFIALNAISSTKATAPEAQALDARFGGWEIEVLGYKYDALFPPLDGLLKPLPAVTKTKGKGRGRTGKTGKLPKAAASN
ncbi:MAG TPA: DUF4340 domain-containing protein [Steroidobacteraceae bacterium]|nr:DUF4340 domain-containing protein [Steroidobacteraceae bacterium]